MDVMNLPYLFETWAEMSAACMPSADFDPFDPVQVAGLPGTATCKDGCKAMLDKWTSATSPGWGCCAFSLMSGFTTDAALQKFPGW